MATLPTVDEPKCGNCKYYREVTCECLRRAPTSDAHGNAAFPTIGSERWCGEHQPDAKLELQIIQRENAEDIT